MKQEKVRYDDPSIVEWRTDITGWVGKDGRYYGKDEHLARYANSTVGICECGNERPKGYTCCDDCRSKKSEERYFAKELVEWDGESWMYDETTSQFFEEIETLVDSYEQDEIELKGARLFLCDLKNDLQEIDLDELNCDSGTEDEGVSAFYPEIQKKVEELNQMIRNAKPALWYPTDKRIDITTLL